MAERVNMHLPAGRYISGDHRNKRTKDFEGRDIPEDKQSFQFGVAVRKDAPGLNELLQSIWSYASGHYARNQVVLQRMALGFGVSTKKGGFSWKIKDGDVPNDKGEKDENAAGCYVFYFSSSFPGKTCNAQNAEIDPAVIKRGHYVDVNFGVNVNDEQGDRAGIYLNQNFIRHLGYGPEIFGGMSAEQAFGNAPPAYLPPGMSQVPIAPAGGIPPLPGAPAMSGFPQPSGFPAPVQQQPNGFPQPGQAPQGFPQTTGFAQNAAPGFPGQAPGFAPAASPSNGMPQQTPGMPGFPQGGFQPPQNAPLPTGYLIDPRTGQPVQPYPGILQPGQR